MQHRLLFEDRAAKYWPAIMVLFFVILSFLFSMGMFTQSVHCENKNCQTETSSYFNLYKHKTSIDQISKVEVVSRRASKGGTAYNVSYGNGSQTAEIWSGYSNLNSDARMDAQQWLSKGMYGNSVHEAKTYTNVTLYLCLFIIGMMVYQYRVAQRNLHHPAKIEIANGLINLVDLGGKHRIEHAKLKDIISVSVASRDDILGQRFGWSARFQKRYKNGGPRGVCVMFKNGKSICVSGPGMSDADVDQAISLIKSSI